MKYYIATSSFLALSASLLFPHPVASQGESRLSLEEVVVTARKRSQDMQDIAGSVQAIGAEDLARNQVTGFDDYARLVPSLNALNSGGGQTQISMRGVFAARLNHAQPQSRSTTGLYIEDIPVTTSAFNPDAGLMDIERIEVLRGPQGTLFGASAMSGVIRIIPTPPNLDKVEGELSTAVSTTKDGGENYTVKGTLNLPINDYSAIRANAYTISNGGYIDNVFTGSDDYNDEESYGGRITALWQPGERFSLKGMLLYHHLEADGRTDEYVPGNPLNSTGLISGGSLIAAPFESEQQWNVTDDRQIVRVVDDPFDDEYYVLGLTATMDYEWAQLTSITSYFDRTFDNTLDDNQRSRDALGAYSAGCYQSNFDFSDPSCEPVTSRFYNDSKSDQFTQELRLNSPGDASVQWVMGAFYMNQNRDLEQNNPLFTQSGQAALADLANVFGFGGLDFGATDTNNIFEGTQEIDTTQYALFGEATIPVGERFELLLGLRLFRYEQQADIFFAGLANDGPTQLDEETSESGVNPNIALKYSATDDINLYASAAKGFRIGGLNDPIPLAGVFGTSCASELDSLGLDSLSKSFDSDELWNYEVGVKSRLADGRATLNSTLFYIDWDDIQTQAFLACGFQTLTNDASLVSKGAEVELKVRATEALSLNLGFSYTDSTLNGDSTLLAAKDGDRAPYVPRWLASSGFEYYRPFGLWDGLDFYIRGDIQYTSNSFSEFSDDFTLPREELDSHTSANVYIGLVEPAWEASLFIKNLTDERIVTGFDADRRQPATFSVARPRTLGVNLKYLF